MSSAMYSLPYALDQHKRNMFPRPSVGYASMSPQLPQQYPQLPQQGGQRNFSYPGIHMAGYGNPLLTGSPTPDPVLHALNRFANAAYY